MPVFCCILLPLTLMLCSRVRGEVGNLRVPPCFVPCRAVPPMGGGGAKRPCAVPCQVFLANKILCRGKHVSMVQIWTASCSFW